MNRPNLIDLFDRGLVKIKAGASIESVLAEYPEYADELRPLFETYRALRAVDPSPTIPVREMAISRAMMMRVARDRKTQPLPRENFFQRMTRAWRVAALPLTVIIVAFSLLVTGLASAQALPGDVLYQVKLAAEQFTIDLTGSPSARISREASYDRRRLEEVEMLSTQQREQEVYLIGLLMQTSAGWAVDGLPVSMPSGMVDQAQKLVGTYVYIHADVLPDGKVEVEWIEPRLYRFTSRLSTSGQDAWRVGDLWVTLDENTEIIGEPYPAAIVDVSAIRTGENRLLAVRLSIHPRKGEPVPTETESAFPTEANKEQSQDEPSSTPAPEWTATATAGSPEASATPDPSPTAEPPTFTPTANAPQERMPTPTKKPEEHKDPTRTPTRTPKP